MKLERILAATDGSENGTRAIDAAVDLAARYDAELVLVHALLPGRIPDELRHMAHVEHMIDPPARTQQPRVGDLPGGHAYVTSDAGGDNELRLATVVGERILAAAADRAKSAGVNTVRQVAEAGDPAHVIVDAARSSNVDLVVAGCRGLGKLKGMLMGSVSHKVQQHAPCSVMIVR